MNDKDKLLTPLQWRVIEAVGPKPRSGREVLARLKEQDGGFSRPLAMFYQLMRRCEEADLLEGKYRQSKIGNTTVRERVYKVTGHGAEARNRYIEHSREVALAREWKAAERAQAGGVLFG